MTSLKTANRRVGSLFAVAALVLATVTPGLVPAFASAAQLTERSVALSSSSKDAEDVSYTITFNTENSGTTGAVVLEFCKNSPLINTACTAPVDFDVSSATATGFTPTALATPRNNAIVLTGTFAATTTIPLVGVDNPSEVGNLYLRIVTFDTDDHAEAYTSLASGTGAIDQGSAGVSITDTIGVSAAVLETMTFCVAGEAITAASCVGASALAPPSIKLGDEVTGALDSSDVYEGSVYSQLSTNAASGAVVSLKSGNSCGGLKRAVASTCEIPATVDGTGITANQARFGIKVATGSDPSGANGALQLEGGGTPFYSSSVFKLDYVAGGASGVTSPFGDPVLNTSAAPANSKNAQITFGASISNDTPAGLYTNDFSLIATGKF